MMSQLTVDGDPLVHVLTLRQLNGISQVPRTQSRRCMLHQVILVSSLRDVLLRLEGLIRSVADVEWNEKRKEKC